MAASVNCESSVWLCHAEDFYICFQLSDMITKFNNFIFPGLHSFFVFYGAQAQAAAAFHFHVPIKMLDGFDDPAAFSHAWAGSQGNRIAFLSAADRCVWLMCIAPGCTAVDECLELSGDICPIRRGDRNNNVGPFILRNYLVHVIPLNTFGCCMTASAAFTKSEFIIVNTDALGLITFFQTFGDDRRNFRCRTIFYGAAIHN